ncbi:collagenase-like [Achroia grisella]|uniref:collagenase-like n=1 Tax=Achroia grisella TaxID=688607 RepID=UPI0027D318C6|nr:collagenase-like [Achroia grisella]
MMYWKTGLLVALAICQVQAEELITPTYVENVDQSLQRIVSGWEAQPGQHPHHVSLRQVNANGGVSACGGSLVHSEWVISAAHCTALQVTLVIRAGVVALSTPPYIYETTEWYNHPTFNDQNPMLVQPNDIALIKLQKPVTFSNRIQPIRVQSNTEAFRDYDTEIVQASGHGRLWTDGNSPEVLNWVYLRAVSNSRCHQLFGSTVINDNSICAGPYNVTSQSTCQGDSGGPLVHISSDGVPVLVGVASFVAGGAHGCHSGIPAGFVRPGPFLGWFEEVSGIDFDNIDEEEVTTWAPEETEPPTTTPEPEVSTEAPDSEEEESDEDSSESDEGDPELSQLLKKLQVQVKVNVKLNKYGIKHEHNHNKTITHHK